MGKFRQFSPELLPLIDVILCSYIEYIFCCGVSCLPAALLLLTVTLRGYLISIAYCLFFSFDVSYDSDSYLIDENWNWIY